MTVLCDTCHAANRDRAMFCGGCARRLQAFVANGPSMLSTLDVSGWKRRRDHGARATNPPGPLDERARRRARRRRWLAGAMLAVSGTVMATLWHAPPPPYTAEPDTRAPAGSPADAPIDDGARTAVTATAPMEAPPTAAPAAVDEHSVRTRRPGGKPTGTAVERNPSPSAPNPPPPVPSRARPSAAALPPASVDAPDDPRVGCEHLFFAFAARCEANHCSKAAYAGHPHCDAVRAEGRRDDARRDRIAN